MIYDIIVERSSFYTFKVYARFSGTLVGWVVYTDTFFSKRRTWILHHLAYLRPLVNGAVKRAIKDRIIVKEKAHYHLGSLS